MAIDLNQLSKTLRGNIQKSGDTGRRIMASLDNPNRFVGFAHILKGNALATDRATNAFATNSAYKTRMLGTKLW